MQKSHTQIILSPRITEKGAYTAEQGVYIFNVAEDSNKQEIAQAIKKIYKVEPRMVRVAPVPNKQVFTRGTNRWGKSRAGKKAYVYLKKGDTIELA